jgi:polyhydroxyalkanoate synthesis repressor PhaR
MMPRPPAEAPSKKETVIKRYANRRLYNSRTGQYVSRKSLEEMARRGEEFVVEDTTTGEDITHSVLGQIIVAQEAVQAQPLLPSEFMRRLLTFYGDTLRTLLGCYLDFSLLTISNETVRRRMAEAGSSALKVVDEQVQQNIKFVESMLLNIIPSGPAANSNKPPEGGRTNHSKTENKG